MLFDRNCNEKKEKKGEDEEEEEERRYLSTYARSKGSGKGKRDGETHLPNLQYSYLH